MRRGASGFMRAFSRLPRLTREIATNGRGRWRARARARAGDSTTATSDRFLKSNAGTLNLVATNRRWGKERDSVSVNELHRAEKLGKYAKTKMIAI